MKTCAFTGHRPQNLPFGFNEEDERCIDLKKTLIMNITLGELKPGEYRKVTEAEIQKLPDGKQLFEYEFNRDIARRMHEALTARGTDSVPVVPEIDDIPLAERTRRVNETERIFRLAQEIKHKFYGNRIVIFAPLYLSNYCVPRPETTCRLLPHGNILSRHIHQT